MANVATHTLDDFVERFEEAWGEMSNGDVPELTQFLPPDTQPDYREICIELMRIDMEYRWGRNQKKRLANYCDEHAWLRQSSKALAELAFEEFRLRFESNDPVRAETYASEFGIDTSTWPDPTAAKTDTKALHNWNESTLDILEHDSERLVASIESFPVAGDKFGDFALTELIGEGKFARVFLARQGELADRPVVLKISAEMSGESDKLARLQHTNIVPIYSVHRIGNLQSLCMPFLGRETLEARFRSARSAEAPSAEKTTGSTTTCTAIPAAGRAMATRAQERSWCDFTAQIADGLAHAHQRKIVHRDLKPANILVSDEGHPLILDFNLSENLVVGGPTSLLVGGTLPYMAPEHLESVLSRERLDARCDVYSVGVMLFEMVTGGLPFPRRDGNFIESVSRMIHDRKQSTGWKSELAQRCSVDMQSILSKCLEPDRRRRYTSAAELREDLRRHASDMPLRNAANRSPKQRLGKWLSRNRHRATLGSVAAVAVALLLLAAAASMFFAGRMRAAEARVQANEFAEEYQQSRLALAVADQSNPFLEEALQKAKSAVARFGALEHRNWPEKRPFVALTQEQQSKAGGQIRSLLSLMANADLENDEHYIAQAEAWPVHHTNASQPSSQPLVTIAKLLSNRKFDAASQALDKELELDPANSALWLQRGYGQVKCEEFSAAELSYTRCIALSPNSFFGYYCRGYCRLMQKRWKAAEQDLSAAIELRPQTYEAYFNRALVLFELKRFQLALEDCNTALEGPRSRCRVLALRAQVFEKLNRVDEALNDRQLAIRTEPDDVWGWVVRGDLQLHDNPEAARDDYEQALAMDPSLKLALTNLAHLYAEILRDNELALQTLDDFADQYPRDPLAVAGQAVVLARMGKSAEAEERAKNALEMNRGAATCYQVASAHALMADDTNSHAEMSISLVQDCLQQDLSWFKVLIADEDFLPLREDQSFLRLLAAVDLLLKPQLDYK